MKNRGRATEGRVVPSELTARAARDGLYAVPSAGFYAIETHSIRFGRDGEWYSDGERIKNRRIADLFSRCVRRKPDGGYLLVMGEERAPIEIEDTPFVVRDVEGDPQQGFTITLNDGTREPLDPATLRAGSDNAFYCSAKGGEYEARLLRPAYYTLARWVRPGDSGRYVLGVGGRDYPIDAR